MISMLTYKQLFLIAKKHIDENDIKGFNNNFMLMTQQMREIMFLNVVDDLLTQLITECEALRPSIKKVTGDPFYQCYSLTGHEYDKRGYCKICHNPSFDLVQNEGKESEILDQVITLLKNKRDNT